MKWDTCPKEETMSNGDRVFYLILAALTTTLFSILIFTGSQCEARRDQLNLELKKEYMRHFKVPCEVITPVEGVDRTTTPLDR